MRSALCAISNFRPFHLQIVQESSALGNAFNEKEMINILSLKVEEINGALHSATEGTSTVLSEIDKLRNEVRRMDW